MRPAEIANIDYTEPQMCGGGLHTFGLISRELEWQIDRND